MMLSFLVIMLSSLSSSSTLVLLLLLLLVVGLPPCNFVALRRLLALKYNAAACRREIWSGRWLSPSSSAVCNSFFCVVRPALVRFVCVLGAGLWRHGQALPPAIRGVSGCSDHGDRRGEQHRRSDRLQRTWRS